MKKVRILAPAAAILLIIGIVIARHNLKSTAEQPSLPPTIALEKDMDLPLGSESNPFTILEIVPCENQAEMGYLIPGCEPIDMDRLVLSADVENYRSRFGGSSGIAEVSQLKEYSKFADEIPSGDTIRGWPWGDDGTAKSMMADGLVLNTSGSWIGQWQPTGIKTMDGYYQRVENQSGTFNLQKKSDGSYEFVSVKANTGGDYRWVTAENTTQMATDYTADQVWTQRSGFYYVYRKYEIVHNDSLIKEVFGDEVSSDEVVSRVITVTPYDFRNPENITLISQVDMIYIHRSHDSGLMTLWEKYNKDNKVLTEEEKARNTFTANDMPWDAVLAIIDRMSEEDPAALMLDESANVSDEKNNCHKLLLMLRQYGPKVFKELFLDTGKIVESDVQSNGLTTGIYNKDVSTSVINWTEQTFEPDIPNRSPEYLKEAGMKNPTFTAENEWTMVQDNIYFYKGDMQMLDGFMQESMTEIPELNGEAFDYYEELYGYRPERLSPLQVTKFLLQDPKTKRTLKILEVEPCDKFIYGNTGWELYYLSLFPWFEGKLTEDVTVVTMPTWQFISSIEDLNSEYDAIIFGTQQDVSNGLNGYRDETLNYTDGSEKRGLKYISIGDMVTSSKDVRRGVKAEATLRYSGNDITQKKLEELKSFLNAGKPIVLDRSFLDRSKKVDTKTVVDISSNMYQLVSMYDQKIEGVNTDCLFVKGLHLAHKLKKALAVETCKIQFDTSDGAGYPVEYSYTPASDGTITDVTYVPTRTFSYKFKIVGKTGHQYGIDLYIDTNGDGVYEGSKKEGLDESAASEAVAGITVHDKNGNTIDPRKLYANVTYTVTKTLEKNYQGILPWKLEAYKIDNENCRSSVVKYSAVKTSSDTKEKIKVLLMQPTPDMSEPYEYYNRTSITWGRDSIFRMDQMAQFKKYLACVDEFDITLEYLSNTDWKKRFYTNNSAEQAAKAAEWKQYLNGYDMLILGFCDDCTFTSDSVYYEGFMYFVNQGKSVILSHDMVRDTSQDSKLKVAYDEQLRQLMGQRRFYTSTAMLNNQEINLVHSNKSLASSVLLADGTTTELPGVFDNSTRQYIIFGEKGKADRDAYTNPGNDKWGSSTAESSTRYINIINEGQITNYPYAIPDLIQVAVTHTQNYQLDMEDKDMVVWYGLTDQYSRNYQSEVQDILGDHYNIAEDKLGRGVYSSVESDGRNSFYIYNRGNITYTGLGHNKAMTDDEVRLFVNTMIASYRAAAAVPGIEITNEDAIQNEDEVILYVTLDDANFNTDDAYLDVHFKVTDPSLVEISGRNYYLKYFDKDNNVMQTLDVTGSLTYQKTYLEGTVQEAELTGMDADSVYVQKDGLYYFKVPYKRIKDEGSVEYNLVLSSVYTNANNENVETMSRKKVVIMPMPLFTLN